MSGLIPDPILSHYPDFRAALTAANLPLDDVDEEGRFFTRFASAEGKVIGFGGLEPYDGDVLLRSVVVLPDYRGLGFGRDIVEDMLSLAASEFGAVRAYLFTTAANSFFEHCGFKRLAREAAPTTILSTRQATTFCSTADLLMRPLGVQ